MNLLATLKTLSAVSATVLIAACGQPQMLTAITTADSATQTGAATRLYTNGTIITMDEQQPTAEAIAVRGAEILAVGMEEMVKMAAGKEATVIDLQGSTLLPGFIDAHGHFMMTLDYLAYENVASAPVGPVKKVADIIRVLRAAKGKIPAGQWIIGTGYDESLLVEQRHPTRFDLDKISTEDPVFIRHVSGHLGVCNSKCLELANITAATEDPAGGTFRRGPGNREPNGVLEETAMHPVFKILPELDRKTRMALLDKTQDYYARYGITSVQDGAANPAGLALLREAARLDRLKLDVIAYPAWVYLEQLRGEFSPQSDYRKHFRVGGVKLVLDGSPQGKTAWLSQPYHLPPAGKPKEYRGYPILSDEELEAYISEFFAEGWQVLAHANGDAAADQLIRTVSKVSAVQGAADRRTVMIHAQTVRDDQLDVMNELNMIPSFFVAHTFYWGDWHRDSVLGNARAKRISPLQSATRRGIRYTIHNDTPVVPPNMALLLWTAVNRETRSGKTLGRKQQATVAQALRAVSIDAASQHFEEHLKGSLEVGKLADFVILDRNPLTTNTANLAEIMVLETIKEGATVYRRGQ